MATNRTLTFILALTLLSGLLLLAVPAGTRAATDCPPGPNGEITLCNPLGANATIPDVLKRIFNEITLILSFVIPIIIIVGAFQMMFAAGNPEKFATGQKTIVYAIIGYVVVLMANGIISIVKSILTPTP